MLSIYNTKTTDLLLLCHPGLSSRTSSTPDWVSSSFLSPLTASWRVDLTSKTQLSYWYPRILYCMKLDHINRPNVSRSCNVYFPIILWMVVWIELILFSVFRTESHWSTDVLKSFVKIIILYLFCITAIRWLICDMFMIYKCTLVKSMICI